jgi:site-specific recombinase XerD
MSSDGDLEEYAEEYRERLEKEGELVEPTEWDDDSNDEIVPLNLSDALEVHEEMQKSAGRCRATIKSHRSRLKKFAAWLKVHDVEKTTEIEPLHFHEYLKQRQKNVKAVTAKTHMDTIRVWMRNLNDYGAAEEHLADKVRSPSLKGDEGQRSDHLPVERGIPILQHLRKYKWATIEHVCFELWWAAGIRLGGVHSLDEKDFDEEAQCVELRHRPDEGTNLKNQYDGERDVGLTDTTVKAISDYINNPERPNVKDDHGRDPILVTENGRSSKSNLRNICYSITLPCMVSGECPHGNDPEDCLYERNKNHASKCESSKSPHALRSGALTRQLKNGINPHHISERANVGLETLEEHYNEMDEREKMEVRRKHFDEEFGQMSREEQEDKLFDRSD